MTGYILLAANVAVWGGLAWLGRNDTGIHFSYYEALPLAMLAASTVPALILWILNWLRARNIYLIIGLCASLPYLFFYTGGM